MQTRLNWTICVPADQGFLYIFFLDKNTEHIFDFTEWLLEDIPRGISWNTHTGFTYHNILGYSTGIPKKYSINNIIKYKIFLIFK